MLIWCDLYHRQNKIPSFWWVLAAITVSAFSEAHHGSGASGHVVSEAADRGHQRIEARRQGAAEAQRGDRANTSPVEVYSRTPL